MPSFKILNSLSDSTQLSKNVSLRIHGRLIAMTVLCVVMMGMGVEVIAATTSMPQDQSTFGMQSPSTSDSGQLFLHFFGSLPNDQNNALAFARDSVGNFYIVGYTSGTNFPVLNSYQGNSAGARDVFVRKYAADGTTVVFSTYFGGNSVDEAHSVKVDKFGRIWVGGTTQSSNFPVVNAVDNAYNGPEDGFVFCLSPDGQQLLFSTFVGGSDYDGVRSLATSTSSVVVVGESNSCDFETMNAIDSTCGGSSVTDGFVVEYSMDSIPLLVFASYLGGTNIDAASTVCIDSNDGIIVSGYTYSSDFPLVNPLDSVIQGNVDDAFILRISPSRDAITQSTLWGGSGGDFPTDIASGANGRVYICGETTSMDFPIANAFDQSFSDDGSGGLKREGYAACFDLDSSKVIFSTYVGGTKQDACLSLEIDSLSHCFVSGWTNSTDFYSWGSFNEANVLTRSFVVAISNVGNNMLFANRVGAGVNVLLNDLLVGDSGKYFVIGSGGGGALFASIFSHIPYVDAILLEGSFELQHVVINNPIISWCVFDPMLTGQLDSIEIDAGTDNNWSVAEKWNPAPFVSEDTFVVYDGSTLVDGATYYVRLRVNNGIAWSPWFESSFRMNSVPTTPVPISPINDAPVGNLPSLYCLNATDAENDLLTYQFEVYADSALTQLEWQGTNTEQPTDTSFGQVGTLLIENARHWWRVRSYDGFEYSPWSATNSFRMNAQQQSPSAFGLVYPADDETIFDMLPTMSWTASTDPDPSDFVRYKMEISLTPSFSFVLVKDSLPTNSFTLTDSLFFGTHYYWRVTARDATGLTVASVPTSGDFWTWELGDVDYSHSTDIGDLTMLVDHLFISFDPILPRKLADLNGDCSVDIGDLTVLVDHLFISFAPLVPGCE